MFEFGREMKRLFGADARSVADESLLELLPPQMLRAEARAADVAAGRVSAREPFSDLIEASQAWREYARRTGDPEALRKAAAQAERASVKAPRQSRPRDWARARLERALASLAGAELFGDAALADAAKDLVQQAMPAAEGDPLLESRLQAAHARAAAQDAITSGDYDRALEAAALFDQAVHRLSALTEGRDAPAPRLQAAAARIDRAELLVAFGSSWKERVLLEQAAADLGDLNETLDPAYEPVTWARAEEVRGAALVALGDLLGQAELIAAGVSVLAQHVEKVTPDHSPVDWAKNQHALALGLQALGEACESADAFEESAKAFDRAFDAVAGKGDLALRAAVVSNRAVLRARRAEKTGDLAALAQAEAAFKAELAKGDAKVDPVGWAVLQVNLARVYEARAGLLGEFREREAAAYALDAAFEVFADRGLKSLAEIAAEGLERVSVAA